MAFFSFGFRVIMVLVLALGWAGPALAAPPGAHLLPPDQGLAPRLRRPDATRLQELRNQREFQYEEPRAQPGQSAWEVYKEKVWRAILRWLSSRSYNHFWRWVFYALFLVAGVFVVLKLMQINLTAVFSRTPRRVALAYDTASENIHEVDFATRLAEAEAAGNLRLAVRLGYLRLLKALSDGGLIQWQPDKTNHAYLAELPPSGLREEFREITRQFEFVWYGEIALSGKLYERVRADHQAFHGQVAGRVRRAA
ncbi:DUF4129 domain-containing protein [Hymenobacter sp. BT664]|uniref:DUF4129 domain-containing protein n=1 Tax=Hymenobacter montanus TaxID=2771359 RepID=A0A927BCA2_9BACT|nr:DUF4129 domain-containing protein [Hymenobacter montanus]MBD2768155.1 DUF4129 domain-containing protein [Hymenobacter montanus]